MSGKTLLYYGIPVILAGWVTAVDEIAPEEALAYVGSTEVTFLDVREPNEYEEGHIPGTLLLPWLSGELEERWQELPTDGLIIVYCRSGGRGRQATAFLLEQGFTEIVNVTGGFNAYQILPDAQIETGPYETSVANWNLY